MKELTVYVRDNDGIVEVTTDYDGPVRILKIGDMSSIGDGESYATGPDGEELYASTEYEKEPTQEIINYFNKIDKRCGFCGRIDSGEDLKTVGGYQILEGCNDCEEEIKKG